MKFGTKAIHGGIKPEPETGAMATPIFQSTIYAKKSLDGGQPFTYSRLKNPTRSMLEQNLATLENGEAAISFSSGMAAAEAVIKLLQPGDEVMVSKDLYGGSQRLFTNVLANFGVKFNFVEMAGLTELEKQINPNTKLIWLETPTNPLLKIIDITAIAAAIAKQHKVLLCVDNTFATPFLQQPLDLGADLVMHSATKYLGGHSDVVLGCVITKDPALAEKLFFIQGVCGAIPGPQDCFLVIRGIKTLHVRMREHCANARKVAEFLREHPKINHVYWPGFSNFPNHEIAKRQMLDFGGVVAFDLKDNSIQAVKHFVSRVKIFTLAESLGGVESLISHPATMSHASLSKGERETVGIVDSLMRLSVGIEDGDDLVDDLKMALDAA